MLWPLDGRAWTASYWWFLGMIAVFTAARLILVTTGLPRTRVRLFQGEPRSLIKKAVRDHDFRGPIAPPKS
jgi:hypothetical protein